MDIKKIVPYKFLFERGKYWLFYVKDIVIFAMALKIFEIDLLWLIPLIGAGFIITILVGWMDLKKGIWREEHNYATMQLNPRSREVVENIREMKDMLRKLCKKGGVL